MDTAQDNSLRVDSNYLYLLIITDASTRILILVVTLKLYPHELEGRVGNFNAKMCRIRGGTARSGIRSGRKEAREINTVGIVALD